MRCRCLITVRGQTRCQHAKHPMYKLPVIETRDCTGCPLKVNTDAQGEAQLPGMFAQAKHLYSDLAAAAGDGFVFVSDRCVEERKQICDGCPMLIEDKKRCAACGCNLPAKRGLRAWKCDLGYWDHIPPDIKEGDDLPPAIHKPGDLKRER